MLAHASGQTRYASHSDSMEATARAAGVFITLAGLVIVSAVAGLVFLPEMNRGGRAYAPSRVGRIVSSK